MSQIMYDRFLTKKFFLNLNQDLRANIHCIENSRNRIDSMNE